MEDNFVPVFAVNRLNLLKKLECIKGDFAVLGTIIESDNFLRALSEFGKPVFLDSGVFSIDKKKWHLQTDSVYENKMWMRKQTIADYEDLRSWISAFLSRCDDFSPDYVFAPDIIGEPLLSLYLNRIAWKEYSSKQRSYKLIGVVQVGHTLYNWPRRITVPHADALLPFFYTPKSFLAYLISEYRNIGYEYMALGGLLKAESTMPMGLKFGLSNQELDDLLSWSRPQFVLGGLALTRLEVLKKHNVWADSSNWLWWDKRYDNVRFGNRNALQEVVS